MFLKKILLSGIFWSGIVCAQTSLSVPTTVSRPCEGSDCVDTSTNRDRVGSGENSQRSADDSYGSTDQSSRSQRQPADSEATPNQMQERSTRQDRNGQQGMVPGRDARSQQSDRTSDRDEPIDFSLEYPPNKKLLQKEEKPTEFQKFVFTSTGERLPIYGRNLFENVPSTFAPVDRIPVPADYAVGPGDELLIRAWGQIDLNARVVVDRDGQIYLPRVGSVTVAGLKYEQLNSYLKTTIGRLFKNFDLNVSLGQLRSIQILVVGQAKQPGTYTVSSLSTLVNALFASGGPDASGSMRRIQLKRQNRLVCEFDLYDLLLNGDKSKDVALLPGDVIYIPPVGHMVAVSGAVNLPAIYEIRDKTTVRDELDLAGGLNTTADGGRAVLERIENRTTRKVEEFNLDDSGLARPLNDGDVLRVFSVSPRFENAITLRGNVAQPGRYPWHEGMRVSDLIPSRDAIIKRDYWMRQNALARNPLGWSDSVIDQRTEFKRNAAEVNWDYAVIQRLNHEDLTARLLPFNLGQAIADKAGEDNLQLMAGDVITIFSQNDLAVPLEKRTKFVWVEGEVKKAGVYRVENGETLRDLVARAGGLTPHAYLFASDFRRESTRIAQQKELERLTDDFDRELRNKATQISGQGASDERLVAQEQIAAQRTVLEKLRQVQATGRVVLEIKPTDTDVTALPALALEDGDRLTIPPKPATVEVLGAVYNQNSFLFQKGRSLGGYLSEAGGGTREADKGRLFVIRADGSVNSKQMHRAMLVGGFDSLRLMPGDTIVMPQKIRTGNSLLQLRDWTQVFAQLALGAASINVITK